LTSARAYVNLARTIVMTKNVNPEALIAQVEQKQKKADLQEMRPGATVAVHQRIVEKGKARTQIFEGIVLKSLRRNKLGGSITVRKMASGVGVERTFFLHSPLIEKVEVKKQSKVRRARLYFLRGLTGRAAVQKDELPKEGTAAKTKKAAPKTKS
jgi:large subunit ribosomal protein L19